MITPEWGGIEMARIIATCPVCGNPLTIAELSCKSCGTVIRGNFELDEFFRLSVDQLNFLRMFIKHRGNLSEVQKELGISYPTARARLEDIIRTLGYEVEREETKEDVLEVLNRLDKGEISVEKAIEEIRRLKG